MKGMTFGLRVLVAFVAFLLGASVSSGQGCDCPTFDDYWDS